MGHAEARQDRLNGIPCHKMAKANRPLPGQDIQAVPEYLLLLECNFQLRALFWRPQIHLCTGCRRPEKHVIALLAFGRSQRPNRGRLGRKARQGDALPPCPAEFGQDRLQQLSAIIRMAQKITVVGACAEKKKLAVF